ncbi:MAG TPA: efflux RND transporter periplasmic adaptor subunit [Bacteroidota bacterium]|nr:efflux RND transporter periplasmic adaptor subunit [Bacteroidota bacterium]
MKKTVYVSAIVLVAVVVSGYLAFGRKDSNKYDLRFDNVSTGDMAVYVTATGTISAVISVDVGTQVSGIVTKLYADFNSIVKAGQVIAKIDTTFLYQSVKDAEASLARSRAQFNDSKRNYQRELGLYQQNLEPEMNFTAALTAYESDSAALNQAYAALDRAKINLAYATIYAPIDGVVVNRAVNVGQTVAASFSSPTLFTIANDLRRMQIQTTVDESDIGRISVGQEATFTVDAYADDKFTGTVSQIRLAPQSIQNVVNYIVIVDVNNDQLKLMPGMTANVKILVASASNVLRVSNMALRFQPPADIIDTAGLSAMRAGFMGRNGRGGDFAGNEPSPAATGDSTHATHQDIAQNGQSPRQFGQGGDFQGSPMGMANFRAIRDSIEKAHGGNLSQEEMRAEMRKLFERRMSQQPLKPVQPGSKPALSKDAMKFGIVSNFPEYQKSSYVASHESGRGRVWILKPTGLLEAVFVRTGLNDGRFTEISSPKLQPGEQVVLGASANGESAASANPLAGGNQRFGGFR